MASSFESSVVGTCIFKLRSSLQNVIVSMNGTFASTVNVLGRIAVGYMSQWARGENAFHVEKGCTRTQSQTRHILHPTTHTLLICF